MDRASADLGRIQALAKAIDRPIPSEAARRVAQYLDLLLRWNARINLTGARSLDELLDGHLPDSFALSAVVPPGSRLVDIGSGGGLPALPFALVRPDVSVTLVEPRAKRVAFLRTAVRELGLGAAVEATRVESIAGGFDVASSRATFPPAEWLTRAEPLLGPGGRVVLFLNDTRESPVAPGAGRTTVRYEAGGRVRAVVAVERRAG